VSTPEEAYGSVIDVNVAFFSNAGYTALKQILSKSISGWKFYWIFASEASGAE
jgi:hypothetical protein